ncbi:hypothetical protein HHK36_007086 [Tetracentron sinense]|uniref:Transcription factor MYC/MYB N-terminal domain-containing protein n=1 Tax=Tetracentron sinense TaxID=13715 RepID=A0A834ZQY8_TETSI|nr:hypothetical protein HHK36_007086 [Tetracentron sinense]
MEEHFNPLPVTHLLQHTLRSLCIHENSQWVYAVFWRILPRNYPPPKWDGQGGAYDRSRGNRRNWILAWEDGFCNFAASTEIYSSDYAASSVNCEFQNLKGLQPELFFKMSHEIYKYGEGLIGKVAADHSHKWVYKEPSNQEINLLSSWHNSGDEHPRTWEAQFQSGIKTIALIAVREGVLQLGAVHKVMEDLSYIALLRKNFSHLESIPGVLMPHPSSSAIPFKVDRLADNWPSYPTLAPSTTTELDYHFNNPVKITPSMNSLEALLSKLPSVIVPPLSRYCESPQFFPSQSPMELMGMEKVAKEYGHERDMGKISNSMSPYHHCYHHHHLNVTSRGFNNGFYEMFNYMDQVTDL